MSARLGSRAALLLLAAGIAVSVADVHRATGDGVGEGHDTSHYLSAATNIRDGKGVTVAFSSGFDPIDTRTALDHYGQAPLTHYPPGYPVAIAATDVVAPGGIETAARLVGLLDVALIAIAAYVLARALHVSPLVSAGVAWAAALTPSSLHLSMWAMSDATAAALTLAAVATAADSVHRHDRRRAVTELGAGFFAAAAATTRFNGVAAAVGVLAIVLLTRPDRRARAGAALRGVGPTIAVLALGSIAVVGRDASPRPLAWHPIGRDDLEALADVVGMWLAGAQSHTTMRVIAAVLAVGTVILVGRTIGRAATNRPLVNPRRAIAVAIATYVVAQLAVIAVTSSLLDADVTADRRILVPIELLAVVVGCVCLARVMHEGFAVLAIAGLVALRLVVPTGALPEGIATPQMGGSPPQLYQLVDELPRDTILVANVPESVWRDAATVDGRAPSRYDKLSGRTIPDLPGRLREMGRLVGARNGLLVLEQPRVFGVPVDSPRELSPAEVAAHLPSARVLVEAAEGAIYDLGACADDPAG